MFAKKEMKKQTGNFVSLNKRQTSVSDAGSAKQTGNLPGSNYFLQRYLGNSYPQSVAGSRPTVRVMPTIQRKCACGGTCASCAGKEDERRKIQAKLKIGQPGDVYEQEADRVADAVMRVPEPQVQRQAVPEEEEEEDKLLQTKAINSQITPLLQRQFETEEEEEEQPIPEEEEEEEELLQAKSVSGQTPEVTTALANHIAGLRGGGQPLDPATRAFMEPRFGHDFSRVRVHTDTRAAESAQAVKALAYAAGWDIVFAKGKYEPHTSTGQRLMAHELTHVVQQTQFSRPASQATTIADESHASDREAKRVADRVMIGQHATVLTSDPVIHRFSQDDCTEDELKSFVRPGDHTAREMIKKVIRVLGERPVDPRVIPMFKCYFSQPPGTGKEVIPILLTYENLMRHFERNNYQYECDEAEGEREAKKCKEGDSAWTYLEAPWTDIHLCMNRLRDFNDKNATARIIIHEFIHKMRGWEDIKYCPKTTTECFCCDLTADEAKKNPDSYACFAQALYPMEDV